MHEVAVCSAVRRFYGYIRFRHSGGVRHLGQHHGDARSQHDAELFSCHQTKAFVLCPVLVKMILIAHIRSFRCLVDPCLVNRYLLARLKPHAYRIFYIGARPTKQWSIHCYHARLVHFSRTLLGGATALLIAAAAIASLVPVYSTLSQTFDEPFHIACGMEWLDRGQYTYEAQHPPLARVADAIGPYLKGLRSHIRETGWDES